MIIIINGSRNAGKTTVANLLATKLDSPAHIEVDALWVFLPNLSLKQAIPINLQNTVSITKNLHKKKFNIVVNYCLPKKDYNYLFQNLKGLKTKIYTITLKPKLSVALSDRGRDLSRDDRKRIREQYGKGKHGIPEIGLIIDTSELTPSTTVKLILKYIHAR